MDPTHSFSRMAAHYGRYSVIQRKVAEELSILVEPGLYRTIVDVGCGTGLLYETMCRRGVRARKWWALDASPRMLDLHPEAPEIRKRCVDFDRADFLKTISTDGGVDLILSSSALQWSRELESVMERIAQASPRAVLSLFTSGTFATLLHCAGLESPIYDGKSVERSVGRSFLIDEAKTVRFRLYFDSVRQMFGYIRHSGVGGARNRLSYRQTRELMSKYPLEYLEFEVMLFALRSRRYSSPEHSAFPGHKAGSEAP